MINLHESFGRAGIRHYNPWIYSEMRYQLCNGVLIRCLLSTWRNLGSLLSPVKTNQKVQTDPSLYSAYMFIDTVSHILGPFVQSIVSLMSSLVVKMLTVEGGIFAEKKIWVAFFSKNIRVYAIFNDQSFNDTFINDIISLTSLLVVKTLQYLIHRYFCKCQSYSIFFSAKLLLNNQSFNDTLRNDIVSFELRPVSYLIFPVNTSFWQTPKSYDFIQIKCITSWSTLFPTHLTVSCRIIGTQIE